MGRMAVTVGSFLCLVAATHGARQTAPAFEVASVKPNTSGSGTSSGRSANGSMTLTNMPLRLLITNAFGMRPNRVIGGPSWIDSERFDISARAPANTTDNQLSLMLRTLITERFKLVARTEARDQPAYALVVARADGRLGPKLIASSVCDKEARFTPAAPPAESKLPESMPCGNRRWNDGRETVIRAGAQPLAPLVRALDGVADGRQVIDRTNLSGTFTFEIRFAPPTVSATNSDSGLPSMFAALEEQLGLKLESTRAPLEVLVIDSVERPTPD